MQQIYLLKKVLISLAFLLVAALCSISQNASRPSAIDQQSYGVVLDDPGMKAVIVKKDIIYKEDVNGKLHIDIYSPPNLKANEKRPAIIFLNAIGDDPGGEKLKNWGIYTTWPQLIAAQGYIGISMESDGIRIQESIKSLFTFLEEKGSAYKVDKDRLGVYAASANVSRSTEYLMASDACKGIKAAVLYYGRPPVGPFRKDLPVMFVISEGDMNPGYNSLWSEVIKNNAPWTIKMATGMPHGFDAYSDNDEARKLVKETISFWKNHLDIVPAPSWKYDKGRDIVGSLQMDHPKAMALLKSITDENPHDVSTLVFYANELRQEGKHEEATTVYNRILAEDPKNVRALVSIAVLSYLQNKDKEAEGYVSRAVATGKITRNDYAALGFYLLRANKNKEAAFYYEKALSESVDGFDYYKLASAYAKMSDTENAIKALSKADAVGYGSKQQIEGDHDFDLIRSDEKFIQLVSNIKR